MTRDSLGEFEQMVLLAVLGTADRPYAISVRRRLEQATERRVSRGALYRTFDRLTQKGYLSWETEESGPERGGHPRRRFQVTAAGVTALRSSRRVLFRLWAGLDDVLEKP